MKLEKRKELSALLSKIVDGRVGDAEMERLEALLGNDREAQVYYLRFISVHSGLERVSCAPRGMARVRSGRMGFGWGAWATAAAAACVFLALGLGLWSAMQSGTGGPDRPALVIGRPSPPPAVRETRVLAVVGSAEAAVWNAPNLTPDQGTPLGTGEIKLESGRIRLDFPAGEQVTLEAPAVFDLVDEDHLMIKEGRLVALVPQQAVGFTVTLPNGAVIDLGTEFAVDVEPDGTNRVKVLKGAVMASSTNLQGSTAWDRILREGEEVSIVKGAPLREEESSHEFIQPLASAMKNLPVGEEYARAVMKSRPVGYWKFDEVDSNGLVADETGGTALKLGGSVEIKRSGQDACLVLNRENNKGFALSEEGFSGLNTARGCSMEIWFYSDSLDWQSLLSLTLEGPRPKNKWVSHAPPMFYVARTGRSGSNRFHVHADYGMRAFYRSPAGYEGGVNVYSDRSHLVHRWYHLVAVRGSESLRIFIDGELTAETLFDGLYDQKTYRFLIGRMHALRNPDTRQWSGAVDEAALYDRALNAGEIREHYQAVERTD